MNKRLQKLPPRADNPISDELRRKASFTQTTVMTEEAFMESEKRKGEKPVPDNAIKMLNQLQILALRRIEGFGWRLEFIRRPLFQEPVAVVIDGTGAKIGILEDDGRVNMEPDIKIRS